MPCQCAPNPTKQASIMVPGPDGGAGRAASMAPGEDVEVTTFEPYYRALTEFLGDPGLSAAGVDEGAEAVEDALQAEGVGVVGVIGRAVSGARGGADAGGRGVPRLVEDPGEQGGVGGPPLLLTHRAVLAGCGGLGGRARGSLDEPEQEG